MNATKPSQVEPAPRGWSSMRRRIVTALIVFHLAAVIFAPLSLDGAFASLFQPFQFLRVYATALYMDHGYRFFAPDPGPTHTIRVEHTPVGGQPLSERIPARGATLPRLLYHRWFMLGESLAAEVASTLASFADYSQNQRQLQLEKVELARSGRVREANQLQTIYNDNQNEFDRHWQMTLVLSRALKQYFETKYPGEAIRVFSRRQLIPRPYDVLLGKPLEHVDFVEEIEITDPQVTLNAALPEEISPPRDPSK